MICANFCMLVDTGCIESALRPVGQVRERQMAADPKTHASRGRSTTGTRAGGALHVCV